MNAEHYAKEAQRLLLDDTLAEAIVNVRTQALEALVAARGDDVIRLQQTVVAIDSLLGELKRAILAMGKMDGGFDPSARPENSTAG